MRIYIGRAIFVWRYLFFLNASATENNELALRYYSRARELFFVMFADESFIDYCSGGVWGEISITVIEPYL